MNANEIIEKLLELVKLNEWQYHNAAENVYCPFCAKDTERWRDQTQHHEGCPFVYIVNEAEKFLSQETL